MRGLIVIAGFVIAEIGLLVHVACPSLHNEEIYQALRPVQHVVQQPVRPSV